MNYVFLQSRSRSLLALMAGLLGLSLLAVPHAAMAYGQGAYYGQGYYQSTYYAQGYYQATYYSQGAYTPPPTCTMSVTPNPLVRGSSATLTWSSTNASSFVISPTLGSVATAGSTSVSPSYTTTYSGAVTGAGGSGNCSTSLTVNAPVQTGTPLIGYAWSDTIGWVDFNCENTSSCGTLNWGIAVQADGTLNGMAWSENIGWISANSADLSGCPSGVCSAKLNSVALSGWLKAVAADGNGWDGWISLSGSGYGPTLVNGVFAGYAWGSDVVGWLRFDVGTDATSARTDWDPCTPNYFCSGNSQYYESNKCVQTLQQVCAYQCVTNICVPPPPVTTTLSGAGGAIRAIPSLVKLDATASITWGVTNVISCEVTATNGDGWTGASGTEDSSPITQQVTYTLTCLDLGNASAVVGRATVNLVPQWEEI